MADLGAHVRPEPIEAIEPRAVTARDLLRSRALLHGWHALCARTRGAISYEAYVDSVDAYESKAVDRRGDGQ